MASSSYVESLLQGIPPDQRSAWASIWRYVLKNVRLGRVVDQEPAENFSAGFFRGTTASVANTEFTIAHNFGRVPYLAIPVLPLNVVNATAPILTVTRAADASRLYLKSATTSATFYVYVEG